MGSTEIIYGVLVSSVVHRILSEALHNGTLRLAFSASFNNATSCASFSCPDPLVTKNASANLICQTACTADWCCASPPTTTTTVAMLTCVNFSCPPCWIPRSIPENLRCQGNCEEDLCCTQPPTSSTTTTTPYRTPCMTMATSTTQPSPCGALPGQFRSKGCKRLYSEQAEGFHFFETRSVIIPTCYSLVVFFCILSLSGLAASIRANRHDPGRSWPVFSSAQRYNALSRDDVFSEPEGAME